MAGKNVISDEEMVRKIRRLFVKSLLISLCQREELPPVLPTAVFANGRAYLIMAIIDFKSKTMAIESWSLPLRIQWCKSHLKVRFVL
jgi:hypothetical protein